MVSQTIDKIISSEKTAADKTESANQESEKIILKAKQQAKEIINKANSNAKIEAEQLIRKNKNEINKIFEDKDKISRDEILNITVKSLEKKEKAIDLVISKIFKEK